MERSFYLGVLFVLTVSCSSAITEVGNPTGPVSTKSRGTLATLGTSAAEFLTTTTGSQALIKAVAIKRSGLVFATSDEDEFTDENSGSNSSEGDVVIAFSECSYDEETFTQTCDCPGGGFLIDEFGNDFYSETEDTVFYSGSYMTTYVDCRVSSCNEDMTVNGSVVSSSEGSFDLNTGAGTTTFTFSTDNECSGIEVDASEAGFKITFIFTSTENDFSDEASGSYCESGSDPITFSSLEEFEELVDPQNICDDSIVIF